MSNPYFIQLIGVFMILAGVVALSVVSYLYGTPLSYDEKRRMGKQGNVNRLPINLETIVSAAALLGGLGILSWSGFELCAFLAYWLPSLSSVYQVLLACR